MGEVIPHSCGVVVGHDLHDAIEFLTAIRHRGDESTGIGGIKHDGKIDILKWVGPVDGFKIDSLHQFFDESRYHTFLLHTRYATKSKKGNLDAMLAEAQPIGIGGEVEHLNTAENNTFLYMTNCTSAIAHNGQIPEESYAEFADQLITHSDSEGLLRAFDKYGESIVDRIPGAFTAAFANERMRGVTILRDRLGIKPAYYGNKDSKFIFASEDVPFILSKTRHFSHLPSGAGLSVYADGSNGARDIVIDERTAHCIFESIYFGHVNSNLYGVSNRMLRRNLGLQLAKQFNDLEADFVTYIPECPFEAADQYSIQAKKSLKHLFTKKVDARSFLNATQEKRDQSISSSLLIHPLVAKHSVEGKVGIALEDSIVRGTVLRKVNDLVEHMGLKKLYLLSMMPPICGVGEDGIERYCDMGIDMPQHPTEGSYFAREHDTSKFVDVGRVSAGFISFDGFMKTLKKTGFKKNKICYHCMGGPHPLAQFGYNV